ncbi:unnamed protein product, partial [Trichobilharzia regenti]
MFISYASLTRTIILCFFNSSLSISSDASAKPELIVKDSSGGSHAVRQISESRATTASDPSLSSSTGINQSSLVLSSTVKGTPINS